MLIGSRSSFLVPPKDIWINPYVTDGLLAMWDGIWNAGPGMHVDVSENWTDVVGGVVLASSASHAFDGTTGLVTGVFTLDVPASIESAFASNWTVNCAIGAALDSSNNDKTAVLTAATANGVFGLSYAYGFLRFRSGCGTGTYKYAAANIPSHFGGTLVCSSGVLSYYSDGTLRNGNSNSTSPLSISGKLQIGGTSSLRRVCLYSRALTASEIAANYAIDKVRFNLA